MGRKLGFCLSENVCIHSISYVIDSLPGNRILKDISFPQNWEGIVPMSFIIWLLLTLKTCLSMILIPWYLKFAPFERIQGFSFIFGVLNTIDPPPPPPLPPPICSFTIQDFITWGQLQCRSRRSSFWLIT